MRAWLKIDVLRFWLTEHAGPLGLIVAVVAIGLLLLPLLYAVNPRGPVTSVTGVVIGFGHSETESGSYPRAVVRLADIEMAVDLHRGHRCLVGAPIQLRRSSTLLGHRYTASDCDVR